jgi:hypothetical protein
MDGDIFGFSPDAGGAVIRGGVMYTEHGVVIPNWRETFIRWMPYSAQPSGTENYADWTDEHRQEVRSHAQALYDRQEEKKAAETRARQKIVDRAKAKLTEEEFDAIVAWAQDE